MNDSYNNECPDCGTPNFTPPGLKAHRGNKNCQRRREELVAHLASSPTTGGPFQRALRVLPADILRKVADEAALKNDHSRFNVIFPVAIQKEKAASETAALTVVKAQAPAVDDTQDKAMGAQLTAQYEKAVGGMGQVVLFGAMMLRLREHLVSPARGENLPTRGPKAKGKGIDAWLKQYAPTISNATAYRFMAVAEAVQSEFKLPAKVQKSLGFAGLVTAKAEELPEDLRAKQLELFEFVNGTSQRSWLDKLRPRKPLGGPRPRGEDNPPSDPAEVALDLWKPIMTSLLREGIKEKSWADLPQEHLKRLKDILKSVNDELSHVK